MSEQPTAMDLWKASRHESTLCKVDGVYFFGDAIIEMHFALERGEMAMSQLRSERDEFAHRIATMKEVIARLERERAAEIEGRKKAEAELKDAQQRLGEWENHVGPYREAEIERLTRERDEALREVGSKKIQLEQAIKHGSLKANQYIEACRERDEARLALANIERGVTPHLDDTDDEYTRQLRHILAIASAALKGDSHD